MTNNLHQPGPTEPVWWAACASAWDFTYKRASDRRHLETRCEKSKLLLGGMLINTNKDAHFLQWPWFIYLFIYSTWRSLGSQLSPPCCSPTQDITESFFFFPQHCHLVLEPKTLAYCWHSGHLLERKRRHPVKFRIGCFCESYLDFMWWLFRGARISEH